MSSLNEENNRTFGKDYSCRYCGRSYPDVLLHLSPLTMEIIKERKTSCINTKECESYVRMQINMKTKSILYFICEKKTQEVMLNVSKPSLLKMTNFIYYSKLVKLFGDEYIVRAFEVEQNGMIGKDLTASFSRMVSSMKD